MSSRYTTTIGLEIHAELNTQSKMWCGCKNDPYEEKPNANVCEVCMAHPGTLPVPNKEAIRKVIQVGLALGSKIADFTEFDRKNYFYPDIPKGYQISQYLYPIVSGGAINGIAITRVHLEEDTASSSHDNEGYTLVNYNRAGVPLMELVTEPVIHSAEEAGAFARELQRILRYVGASEANMEMGQMRVEANISVSKDKTFGTKCEVKNLNSFKSVEDAIRFEVERHIALIEEGGKVVQETRGWDEVKQETFSQRKKENAHDYRYFPDPDLPKMYLHEVFDIEAMRKEIPELASSRAKRLTVDYALKSDIVEIIVNDRGTAEYFDTLVSGKDSAYANLVANYLVVDVFGLLKKEGKALVAENFPSHTAFSTLLAMISANELSSRGAKDLLPFMLADKSLDVKKTAEKKGLIQTNDTEALKKIVTDVIAESAKQVADYKSGKESMFMYFVGQCMKKSKGAGNPQLFQELLKDALA
ncbi:MAG: aspartyl-tRNA(Asn)/glutamyl-tRNA(Gln) amidotransferase subunit [Patescibacteria group bacterium]|nr:aspartyl-tRNA(Asn)/glutamyl-tRNA(Gln) amidotransferase subunit [Patescibacteria group bacterium]